MSNAPAAKRPRRKPESVVPEAAVPARIAAEIALAAAVPPHAVPPAPSHRIYFGDSRSMTDLAANSVHLVITSPPYWQLKDYGYPGQIGFDDSLAEYGAALAAVWRECHRVLLPGCRLCVNIGDQFARAAHYGRYKVIPLHAQVIIDAELAGFDFMGSIIWRKVTTTHSTGGGAVMGSFPFPRNGIVKLDYEHILLFKKLGDAPKPAVEQKAGAAMSNDDWNSYFSGHWHFPGEKQGDGHIAMFPTELPHRLIRMFSFPGETVLDPFVGSGTTVREAMNLGRVGVGYEINPEFESAIRKRLALPDPAQMALFEGADQEQVLFLRSGELEPPLLAPKDPMEPMTVASTLGELLAVEATPVIEEVPAALEPLQAAEPGPEALTPTGAAHPDNGIKRNPNPRAFRSVVSLEDAQKRVVPGVKVKEILGPNLILLADGKRISFLGLEPRPGAEEGVMEYLNEVILGQSVELKNLTESTVEGEPARAFVYLLNKTFVNARLVKMGFFVPDGTQHRHTKRFEKFAEEVRAFLEEEMGMTDEDEFDAGALGTGALDAELVDQP